MFWPILVRPILGKRCLIKAGSSIYNQEPFNEVIATKLYERILLSDEYVKYSLYEENNKYYSICKDMIDENTELIPAYAILNMKKERGSISLYEHYISCLNEFGIIDARTKIDKMLVCDYILSNTDRHFGNFGVIRDINTLKMMNVAPIFDNGTSLYSKENTVNIKPYTNKLNKNNPFKNNFKEQLYLVKDLSWLDTKKLNGFHKEVEDILKKNIYIDKERIKAIMNLIESNIKDVIEYKKYLDK